MGLADGYVATCRREGASWAVRVPAVGRRAPARRLTEAERVAAGLVAAATGKPRDAVAVRLELDVPADLRALVEAATAARREPDHVSPAAVTRRRALARRLVAEDFSIADVAYLLGVSVARAHQLAGRGRPKAAAARATRPPRPRPVTGRAPRPAARPRTAPASGFQHEAFLYHGDDEFLAGTVPFVRDGVELGEPVMVAVVEPRLELLREELGDDARAVEFVDMGRLGANPAKIIPRWRRFVDEHAAGRRPLRGVGEPIWAGRRPAEVVECQLHEALLNVAVDPDLPLWLSCPYDAGALDADVLAEVSRSHHTLVEEGVGYRGSTTYGGLHHVDELFRSGLPEPVVTPDRLGFGGGTDEVRALVVRRAAEAGLTTARAGRLAAAVAQLATNSAVRGGGAGVLRVWLEPEVLTCEVSDHGYVDDPLVGRHGPDDGDDADRAVRVANEVGDLTQVRSTAEGTAVRVLTWL
jgi:hypothetical protein